MAKKILLADDEADIVTPVSATDGETALKPAKEQGPTGSSWT